MMQKRAFTLFELLVVCAILALLSALLLPAFTEARVKAKMSGDLSNLRQIGAARALYMMDHDEREVWSTIPLVRAGYLPQEMVRSPLDPTTIGMANVKRRSLSPSFDIRIIPPPPARYETTYIDSYIALAMELEEHWETRDALRELPGFGWLINSNNGRPPPFGHTENPRWTWSFFGPFHRLLPDGAVVPRMVRWYDCGPGCTTFLSNSPFVDNFYTYEQWQEFIDKVRRG